MVEYANCLNRRVVKWTIPGRLQGRLLVFLIAGPNYLLEFDS
jgi:hypothetical protein